MRNAPRTQERMISSDSHRQGGSPHGSGGLFAALLVLYLLVVVGILAPLLANDRPLFVRARLPGILTYHLKSLKRAYAYDVKKGLPGVNRALERTLRHMRFHLVPEAVPSVDGYLKEWADLNEPPVDPARQLAFLDRVVADLQRYPARRVVLFPALAALAPLEAALMGLVLLLPLVITVWWLRERQIKILGWSLALAGILALLIGMIPPLLSRAQAVDFRADLSTILAADPAGAVVFPPVPFSPESVDNEVRLLPPFSSTPAGERHLLGTDDIGRDILCLLIWGSRTSLMVGLSSVVLLLIVGIGIGGLAGYLRGGVDLVVCRVIEVFQAFPAMILILAAVAFLRSSIWVVILVIGLTRWTTAARLMRGEVLRLNQSDFVAAARTLGLGTPRILLVHILPNSVWPVLVHAVFAVAAAVLMESSLSFLGLGEQGVVSWGQVIDRGRSFIDAWWITVFPGLGLFLTILTLRVVGEGVRTAAGPRCMS